MEDTLSYAQYLRELTTEDSSTVIRMVIPNASSRQLRKLGATVFRVPGRLLLLAMICILAPGSAWPKPPKAMPDGPTLPAGKVLYLHLQTAVSTKTSKEGQAVAASLAREVDVTGGIGIPFGATLNGTIAKCSQPTAADQRAELLLSFDSLTIPGEGKFPVKGHLSGVSNARETLTADGTIVGVLESETPASLLSGVLGKLGQMDTSINDQIQKQKIGQVNTAIELPLGTDLQFTLTEPLSLKRLVPSGGPRELPAALRSSVENVLADAPKRAVSKANRPGDPINLVFVGTAQEIEQAFRQAGWNEPKKKNQQSIWKTAQAVINDDGYNAAPVSDLYVFGRKEDLAFEKTLDTFNKRHHLRLWQAATTAPDGRPIWLAAATHDIGIDVHPGVISHATDSDLDDERSQVGYDLYLGGSVQAAELVAPPSPLNSGVTATGGKWHTDGRLFVIDLKGGATASR
ncbi:MAG: LssY C-terminal domain-containing protein [Terriglobia bacterium]